MLEKIQTQYIIKETKTYLYPYKGMIEIRYYGKSAKLDPYGKLIPYVNYKDALRKLEKLKKISYTNATSVYEIIETDTI